MGGREIYISCLILSLGACEDRKQRETIDEKRRHTACSFFFRKIIKSCSTVQIMHQSILCAILKFDSICENSKKYSIYMFNLINNDVRCLFVIFNHVALVS